MKFRGIRFGAVLLPVGVAILPLSVLIWYGAVRIPRQEAYLSERNLRLLTTLSGPIKAKIESFDGALDHAVKSFEPKSHADLKKFQQGVRLFAPDLDVVDEHEGIISSDGGDTQRVRPDPRAGANRRSRAAHVRSIDHGR
jgi:hypothetical protein